ncbi:MAG: septum formation protein Maf [Rhodospirillales bacterium]|nr:septum formation protein Maf [Alphaproteobacteria bacterium]USO04122.1 MAG: septum formation protein Maf [Rhodospirillales bacterium]
MKTKKFVLASGSQARIEMLKHAGLAFDVHPADLDEAGLQKEMAGQLPAKVAGELARQKALTVSGRYPEALVVGADQILVFEGGIVSKSNSKEEAGEKLLAFKGKPHRLISAVSVCRDGKEVWSHRDEARLFVKDFDDNFLEEYLKYAGDALTGCVGGYALEGLGIRLFEKIEGDYFTILGLPLLPLLNFLDREEARA